MSQEIVLDGPDDGVAFVQLEHWQAFHDLVCGDDFDWSRHIWRGQQEQPESRMSRLMSKLHAIRWLYRRKLVTGAEQSQTLQQLYERVRRAAELEGIHLDWFQDATRGRLAHSRRDMTADLWWQLGQHFGLHTPLLDWTESPFVAAFFALAKPLDPADSKRAVYALSEPAVSEASSRIDRKNAEIREKMKQEERVGVRVFEEPTVRILRPRTDDNPRLVNQRGLFTWAELGIDIEGWVTTQFQGTEERVLTRIWLPEEDRAEFLKALNKMNINHLTLFPDLYGATQYCNMKLEIEGY